MIFDCIRVNKNSQASWAIPCRTHPRVVMLKVLLFVSKAGHLHLILFQSRKARRFAKVLEEEIEKAFFIHLIW